MSDRKVDTTPISVLNSFIGSIHAAVNGALDNPGRAVNNAIGHAKGGSLSVLSIAISDNKEAAGIGAFAGMLASWGATNALTAGATLALGLTPAGWGVVAIGVTGVVVGYFVGRHAEQYAKSLGIGSSGNHGSGSSDVSPPDYSPSSIPPTRPFFFGENGGFENPTPNPPSTPFFGENGGFENDGGGEWR